MNINRNTKASPGAKKRASGGFCLEEVVTAMALTALCFVGTVKGYILASQRAEWAASSLSAQSAAFQRLEQVTAAKWDTMASPPVDELASTNFPMYLEKLDMPLAGTNGVYAAVTTTISDVSMDPPLRLITIEAVWTNHVGKAFTNSLVAYRSPDQ